MESITSSKEIYHASVEFIVWRSYGIFFGLLNAALIAFYVGTKNTWVLVWTTLLLTLTNIFLDYSLVFGNFGFPAWGVKGAAVATVTSEALVSVLLLIYSVKFVDIKKYKLFNFVNIQLDTIINILKTSGPMMIQSFVSLTAWFIFFTVIEKMGQRELAVSQIIKNIYMLLVVPIFGYNSAMNTITSNLIGEGKNDEVIPALFKVLVFGFLTNFIAVFILQFYPLEILGFFTTKEDTISLALTVINIIKFEF